MNKGFSTVLNASRWFAAFLVVICHVRHLILVDLKNVLEPTLPAKGFYFFTGLGPEAVVVFFVVSGLLVGALTLEKWRIGNAPGFVDYFIHRFSRIYIVLIPAIIAGLSLDNLGISFFDAAELYTHSPKYHTISMGGIIKDHVGIEIVLGNLFMLQKILVSPLGSNGPLWSLAYEWWYYMMWALMLAGVFCRGFKRWFSLAGLMFLLICLPLELVLWMNIWLLGVGVFYYGRSSLPKPSPWVGMAVFLLTLCISRISHNPNNLDANEPMSIAFSRDFSLGLAYSVALISCWRFKKPLWMDKIHSKLAGFSYSLYLAHFPMMVFLVAIVKQCLDINFLQQPSWQAYIYFTALSFVLILYAYGFSLLTEKYTYKMISYLRTVFLPARAK